MPFEVELGRRPRKTWSDCGKTIRWKSSIASRNTWATSRRDKAGAASNVRAAWSSRHSG